MISSVEVSYSSNLQIICKLFDGNYKQNSLAASNFDLIIKTKTGDIEGRCVEGQASEIIQPYEKYVGTSVLNIQYQYCVCIIIIFLSSSGAIQK